MARNVPLRPRSPFRFFGRYRDRQSSVLVELTPLRITLVYLVFGMAALFLSDVLFVRYLSEPVLSQLQALKGGIEVMATAGLIYALTWRSRGQIEASAAQLERNRDERQLLHRVFRHHLRNDINIIHGYTELVREEVRTAEGDAICDRIVETTRDIMDYTEDARRIRAVTEQNGRSTFDLSELIPRVLEANQWVTDDVRVATDVPADVEVRANPLFGDALDELVSNAIEHNDADRPSVTIDVDPSAGPGGMTEFQISDDGPGIPATEIEALDTDRRNQVRHSLGLGLWFVDWVLTHSAGTLTVDAVDSEGTVVTLWVPNATEYPWPVSHVLDSW